MHLFEIGHNNESRLLERQAIPTQSRGYLCYGSYQNGLMINGAYRLVSARKEV